jgi:choline kinase
MKAIIVAAGMGRRMGPMTRELPKCLAVSWNGSTLFDTQLATLRSCGVTDVSLVRGHHGDKFRDPGITYFWNHDYEHNNVLESLMCARSALVGECLVLYSDIWFEPDVVKALMACDARVAAVVDRGWEARYRGRTAHPPAEAETAVVDDRGTIREIGKLGATDLPIAGEFIGMMKVDAEGAELLKARYDKASAVAGEQPFHRAPSLRQAYLTDMLQDLAGAGVGVKPVMIDGGWHEIDTVQDFENLLSQVVRPRHQTEGGAP